MQPPQSFLSTMEDYVKDAPRAGATLMLKNEPVSGANFSAFTKCGLSLYIFIDRGLLSCSIVMWNESLWLALRSSGILEDSKKCLPSMMMRGRRMESEAHLAAYQIHLLNTRRRSMRMLHQGQMFLKSFLLHRRRLNQLVIFWWVHFSKVVNLPGVNKTSFCSRCICPCFSAMKNIRGRIKVVNVYPVADE